VNTQQEQNLRDALHQLSDQAPHDPDLVKTVLAAAADPARPNRYLTKRVIVPTVAALVAASVAVAVGVGLGGERRVGDPAPADVPSLSPAEVEELTRLGPLSDDFDDAKAEQAWQQKWGVADIGAVTDALRKVAETYPKADAGMSYDPDTLTYTQWTVRNAADAEKLRDEITSAFESIAGASNLSLKFGTSPTPEGAADPLMADMSTASRTDPLWPKDIDMSGHWSPEEGKFMLAAGDAHDDPTAVEYFERRWPGLVTLTDSKLVLE
jgi:hypothetical protein